MTADTDALGVEHSARPASRPLWAPLLEAWARSCRAGQITVTYPNGSSFVSSGARPGPAATIELHNARPLWRMLIGGDVGLGESYVAGDWSSPDLPALIAYAFRNEADLAGHMRGSWVARMLAGLRFRMQENTRSGARKNIAYHYDLGNDFYAAWLDKTMTYSSALFTKPGLSLAEAQQEKYRRIVERLGIRAGDRVLEIGCGWGGFAEFAAREVGARVTAITISNEQATFARDRIAAEGLSDLVEMRVVDYRDVAGTFDAIVSIEMLEAVGEKNWPDYFEAVNGRLRQSGRALIQVITVPDERFDAYRQTVDFIQLHVFPGGMLLSPSALSGAVADAGLALREARFFGQDYATTLRIWNESFQNRWDAIRHLGFDERFRRLWTYYLNSCEACFREGATDVGQFLLEKP